MKYIGIRGHRGAGKKSVTYLLGNTIEYLIMKEKNQNNIKTSFDDAYNTWVQHIMDDESIYYTTALKYVYFDSFGDTLKIFVHLLTGIPTDYIYNDYYKDHTVINLKDFTYKTHKELPNNILTKDEVYSLMNKPGNPTAITKNIYITLREFILYFGIDVMQRYFGLNVWVKALKQSENNFDDDLLGLDCNYKIFSDVKTPSEVTYILDNGGCIIHVTRPNNHKKPKGFDKLSKDGRIDYTIHVGGDLYEIKNQILEIAKQIIDKNGKN